MTIISAIWYHLIYNTTSLNLNISYFNKIISRQFDQAHIKIAQTNYHYDPARGYIIFDLKDVTIDHQSYIMTLPHVHLTYKPKHIFRLKFIPKKITIENADVLIKTQLTKPLSLKVSYLKKLEYLNKFKSIKIQNSFIHGVNHRAAFNFNMQKIGRNRYAYLNCTDENHNKLTLQAHIDSMHLNVVGYANCDHFAFKDLIIKTADKVYVKSNINFKSPDLTTLACVASNMQVTYDNQHFFDQPTVINLSQLLIKAHSSSAQLKIFGYLSHPDQKIKQVDFLGNSHFQSDSNHNQTISAHHKISLYNCDVQHLPYYWPKNLAKTARTWITHNFKSGLLPFTEINMDTVTDAANQTVVKDLKGYISTDQLTLSYVDTMPHIKNIKGYAFYNLNGFDIYVQSGECNGVKIKDGRIKIGDFLKPDFTLSLSAPLLGTLNQLITIINAPPLHFASQISYLKNYQGNLTGILTMRFPLKTPFDPQKIAYSFNGQFAQFKLSSIFDLSLNLTQGNFKTYLDNNLFQLNGSAFINDALSTIDYRKELLPKIAHYLKITAKLGAQQLQPYNIDLRDYWQGTGLTTLTLQQIDKSPAHLKIYTDLQASICTHPLLAKPFGTPAFLGCDVQFENHKISHIKNINLTSDYFKATGAIKFSNQPYQLNQLNLTYYYQDKIDVKLNYNQLNQSLNLSGNLIDLSAFDNFDWFSNRQQHDFTKNINLRADFDTVILNPKYPFRKMSLHLRQCEHQITDLALSVDSVAKQQPTRLVNAQITTYGDQSLFTFKSQDAGLLITSLNFGDHIKHGILNIIAEKKHLHTQSNWQGDLQLKKFSIRQVHGLARLIAAVFPTGLMDLKSDAGLAFNLLRSSFNYQDNKLILKSGHAFGHSLGITFKGDVILKHTPYFNLTGSIIPAYFFNALLSKIPVIGHILLGGENEGLFAAAFAYKGQPDQARIKINPLSTLTPGFLRQLFINYTESDIINY